MKPHSEVQNPLLDHRRPPVWALPRYFCPNRLKTLPPRNARSQVKVKSTWSDRKPRLDLDLGTPEFRCSYGNQIIYFAEIPYRGTIGWCGRLHRDSPSAAPGSSPPAGTPSASSAPLCSRDAPPPTHGSQQRRDGDLLMISSSHQQERNKQAVATTQAKASIPNLKMEYLSFSSIFADRAGWNKG